MKLVKGNVTIGIQTRFGANWPGKRCLAKTRRGTECQRAAYKHNGHCRLHGGLSTGARTQEGVQRISDANIKHGRQTKDKKPCLVEPLYTVKRPIMWGPVQGQDCTIAFRKVVLLSIAILVNNFLNVTESFTLLALG
jgi:hypothetical protein